MIGALRDNDYSLYEKIFKYRKTRFDNLMTIEGDLMEFGNFSWSDIQKLKVLERRYHINRINETLKKKAKQSLS